MSNELWTEVRRVDVRKGDKLRLTFNLDDAEHVITGTVTSSLGTKIERAEPDWTNAALIRVQWDGHYVRTQEGRWQRIGSGERRYIWTTEEVRAWGVPITVILDEHGKPVGGDA